MELNHLTVTYEEHIAILTLDSPPANALSSAMIAEMRTTLQQIENQSDVHAIILTGAGKFFAAGANIKEFVPAMGDYQKGIHMSKAGQDLCNELEAMKKPVIAAINGPALGGGLEVAMGCHYRIASNKATVGLPEVKLGLVPSFGGTQRLTRITGVATALELILTGKHIDSYQAQELGIVQVTVAADELMAAAKTIAHSFVAGNSMQSVTRAVESVVQGARKSFADGLQRENEIFGELFLTADAKEGVQAFVEKRKPDFHHQ
ncbi:MULTISPECIES: enoyl-CoA hydratase-related protein [Clostridia]|uniref:enoyl-CoA hydratase-related protein n=1 Tax=Clostridia TaxID=186801 RepID=UPI000EA0DC92|nr:MULTISPECIES: enoyl-CoA hydratase-related protein [Clostridia]NBJ69894.1 enoyl-CoA hydratase [Roseburia sp. 1XD42-34]RKI77695.1 enoyl-CoA hydratase [Clostridium sp. 1xD42-85]